MRKKALVSAFIAVAAAVALPHALPAVAFAEETGIVEDASGTVEPERDEASGAYANSFRFTDGYPDTGGVALLGANARSGLNTWSKQGDVYVATDGTRVQGAKGGLGIDVSEWQASIDWKAVKNSGLVDFAIIRCGYGSDSTSQDDKQFVNNVRGAMENGIPFGIYIYSYAYNTSMAQSEANHVLRLLRSVGITPSSLALPVYIDLENEAHTGRPAGEEGGKVVAISNSMLEQIANTFCTALENAGYRPGVYANLNWWNNYLNGSIYNRWSKWVAQYNSSCSYGGKYDMWQCMSDGSIPGISGAVDINFDFTGLSNAPTPVDGGKAMYRLYNPNSGEHFYTGSADERNGLISVGWRYEGVAWYAPESSSTPVYRLYNPVAGDHHYTTSKKERDDVVRAGWRDEGIGWYSDDAKGMVLYRVYNPNAWTGAHHYTFSAAERDSLIRAGWRDEGYAWYGMK